MKYIIEYCGQTAMVSSVDESINAIQSFHSYGRKNEPFLQVNSYTLSALTELFDKGEVRGYKFPCLRTTNCGCKDIRFFEALGDTLEEHEAAYKDKCEAERKERIRKSQEEKERRIKSMSEVRRGWYSVMMTFHCYYWSERRCEMQWGQKNFSGQVIANSQMDAYNKACHDIETRYDPSVCQGPEFPDPTNQSMFDAYFLGMKTDEGYSIEAWEEFSKTDEYKESVK